MDESRYLLQSLELAGFRAYLNPKKFDFSNKRSLAIFAPNGYGKSSLIDALEFVFSRDGTLDRLGLRTVNNQAGSAALAHCRAEDKNVEPRVAINFIKGKDIASGTRTAAGNKRPMPAIADTVNRLFTVSPIVRGHALRTFVESQSPEQRYADIATWLQLGPLVEVQKNLRELRAQIKIAAKDTDALKSLDAHLARETANAITHWDDRAVIEHVNASILGPLDAALIMVALDCADTSYVELLDRVSLEERQVGLAALRGVRQAAASLWHELKDEEVGTMVASGAIAAFEAAAAALTKAAKNEADERGKAANTAFEALWRAAEPHFAPNTVNPDVCPVCSTPVDHTTAGSVDGIRQHLAEHLQGLAAYAEARKSFDNATAAADTARTRLSAMLLGVGGLLGEEATELNDELVAYGRTVDAWVHSDPPDSALLVAKLLNLLSDFDKAIKGIEVKQGEHTYAMARRNIDRLLELHAERVSTSRIQTELEKLQEALNAQATVISVEIRKKVQTLLDKLQAPMNEIYKLIQGSGAPPIHLELPPEDDTNQQRLNLVIDFAKNRSSVQPGGYLSDSQIHSVALALRMAAIKQFNGAVPIIALDDIVTSYDADHRRTAAGLIATIFSHWQVIITTHDERFFNYLKDQVAVKDWQFMRITGLDPSFGPRFADHKVSDEMIEVRWDCGASAANEMRQAEEEWLLSICRDFGVNVRIRALEKAYSYERSELASALASFLNGAKLNPQPILGVNSRFMTSLQKGEIENFGSHFQDGPYGDGSIGDERTRWAEFKSFRGQFACPKCARPRFKRPHDFGRPVCAHSGCEAQFEFAAVEPSNPPGVVVASQPAAS